MTSIEPQLWTDRAAAAVAFYEAAFGAVVLHRVGDGDDIVAQLAVGDARFWVSAADPEMERFDPAADRAARPDARCSSPRIRALQARAVEAGATELAPVTEEYGWRLGRIVDPFGHEWELGHPLGDWPPR